MTEENIWYTSHVSVCEIFYSFSAFVAIVCDLLLALLLVYRQVINIQKVSSTL